MSSINAIDDELTKRLQGYESHNKAIAFVMEDDIKLDDNSTIPGWQELIFEDITILI